MFLKILGAIAITASSYIFGLYLAGKPAFRNQDLEQLKKALTIFKGEITYSCAPMESMFKEISQRTDGVVSMLFNLSATKIENKKGSAMIDIWSEAMAEISKNSYFDGEDMEYIYSFGRTLGYADKGQQADNAKLLIEYIEHAQRDLRIKRASEEKLYKTLGVMCGLMISLVLF